MFCNNLIYKNFCEIGYAPQSIEAILYLLQGVSSHLHQHSSPHLQSVISLFPRMPLHPILVKTAITLLGKHLWIQAHAWQCCLALPTINIAKSCQHTTCWMGDQWWWWWWWLVVGTKLGVVPVTCSPICTHQRC